MIVPIGDNQPCTGATTVTDFDGNIYNTVQIGQQCWMKENLRTIHYSNGTYIPLGSSTSTTTAYRYYPNNDQSNVSTYGYLYNWKAVMGDSSSSSRNPSGVLGICPIGWHVPSDSEWTRLTDYVSSQSQYVCGNYTIYNCGHLLNQGLSVRCVRNELVYTLAATDVTQISATLNGSISNSDNEPIIAQGFQWKQETESSYQTVNAIGSNMSFNLTGLTANTTYIYRAFVTTADSTFYGIVRSFTTRQEGDNNGLPCTGNN